MLKRKKLWDARNRPQNIILMPQQLSQNQIYETALGIRRDEPNMCIVLIKYQMLTFGSSILRSKLLSTKPELASNRRRARSTRANVGLSIMDGVRLGGPEFDSDVNSMPLTITILPHRNYSNSSSMWICLRFLLTACVAKKRNTRNVNTFGK